MKEAEDVGEDQLGHDDHLHHEGGGEDLGVRVGARVPAGKSEDEEESEGKSERRWRTTGLGSEEEEEVEKEKATLTLDLTVTSPGGQPSPHPGGILVWNYFLELFSIGTLHNVLFR